ncbi:MAG: hypothetical protein K0R17_744 [Rariglobus sp.]|jgi:hypothetical protein|nr:hypothetical protein [Rariglobus sp.]
MNTLRLAFFALLFGTAASFVTAQPADARLGAYRASIAQEAVQTDADKTKSDLAALIAEARLNGIGDENGAALQAFLAQLGTLTQDDMRKVIEGLKTASGTAESGQRQTQILAASENQQAIANRLFALANNIAANHAKQSLPHDLRDLIGRQLANIRLTLRLQAPGVTPEPADFARVAGSQKSIAKLIDAVIETMTQLVATLPAGEAAPIKASLDYFATAKLTAVAEQASGAAADKALPASGRLQARVRDILLSGTQAMADKQTLADKLIGLSETLERLIAAQIELNADTRAEAPDAPALASRQTGLADETGILRTTTPGVAKETTETLEVARLAMQAASGTLGQGDTGEATRIKQAGALDALRLARGQVLTQLKTEMERLDKAEKALADAQAQVKNAQTDLAKSDAAGAGKSLDAAAQSADAAKADGGLPPAADASVDAAKTDLNAAAAANATDAATSAPSASGPSADAKKEDASTSAASAASNLAAAAAIVAQTKAGLASQAAAAGAAADDQAAAAAGAAAAAANTANSIMQDGAASTDVQANAANSAADAADGAAAAATTGDAKASFEKAAASFREAAAAAKAGKPQLAIDAAATGNKIVSDSVNAMMIARSASNASGPSGAPASGLNSGFTSSPAGPGAQVLGTLKPRDREAIEQARSEKTPPEFTPLVRQYFKNLADDPRP